ncbi:unnamed protein product [Rotaria magnacalcarata]|uniref:Uncharacterized protein n=1 Tax=Rotaria magnacalcarata TaxID=392030 RepID=A0A815L3C9_9BILA|nr:unnamed protein product [Rotaria magnacalcarata]CAF1615070.1 unnamed protein product [Rotaria magnacalcarata]
MRLDLSDVAASGMHGANEQASAHSSNTSLDCVSLFMSTLKSPNITHLLDMRLVRSFQFHDLLSGAYMPIILIFSPNTKSNTHTFGRQVSILLTEIRLLIMITTPPKLFSPF